MRVIETATPRFIALYAIGYVGSYIALITPVVTTLAIKIEELDPQGKEASLGVIAALGALMAIVANLLTGALSDRTRSRLGRRRPWIIGGALGGIVALGIVGFAPNLLVVAIGWMLAQLTLNMVLAALQALLPDQVPLEQRARVSAVLGIAQQVSPLLGIGLALGIQPLGIGYMLLIPGIVGAALMILLALTIKDVPHDAAPPFRLGEFIRTFAIEKGKRYDFAWTWFGRFFVILGFAVYTTYQPYYITDRLGVPEDQRLTQQFIALLIFAASLTVSALTLRPPLGPHRTSQAVRVRVRGDRRRRAGHARAHEHPARVLRRGHRDGPRHRRVLRRRPRAHHRCAARQGSQGREGHGHLQHRELAAAIGRAGDRAVLPRARRRAAPTTRRCSSPAACSRCIGAVLIAPIRAVR